MIIEIIRILLIFAFGSLAGWIIEFFYRGMKMNPGFLGGPYLPLYGTGTVILNYISGIGTNFMLKLVFFAIATTLLELFTGIFFIMYYKIRLWDYSKQFLNFKEIICPLYTFYWTILSALFLFFIYPFIGRIVDLFYKNLELGFFVGVFYGVFIVDLSNSFKLAARVKNFLSTRKVWMAINIDFLKSRMNIRLKSLGHNNILTRFFSSPNILLNNELFEQINLFFEKNKNRVKKMKNDETHNFFE